MGVTHSTETSVLKVCSDGSQWHITLSCVTAHMWVCDDRGAIEDLRLRRVANTLALRIVPDLTNNWRLVSASYRSLSSPDGYLQNNLPILMQLNVGILNERLFPRFGAHQCLSSMKSIFMIIKSICIDFVNKHKNKNCAPTIQK
jgi:hypothetical protein